MFVSLILKKGQGLGPWAAPTNPKFMGIAAPPAPLPPGVYVLLIYFALHNVTIKRMDF